jgi:hypothetical protein
MIHEVYFAGEVTTRIQRDVRWASGYELLGVIVRGPDDRPCLFEPDPERPLKRWRLTAMVPLEGRPPAT